jgi:DNA-binding NarL/FixJ family response regulator
MQSIRLFLIDDHLLFRESLSRLLALEPDFEVVGECGHSAAEMEALRELPVDVVLLDSIQGRSSTNFLSHAKAIGYLGKVLLVTGGMEGADALQALQLGVSGIFSQRNPAGLLTQAIRTVAGGEIWLDSGMIQFLVNHLPLIGNRGFPHTLTDREREVLNGVLEGMTNRRIAANLGLSEGTVKATIQALFRQFNVHMRSQLVRAAVEGSTRSPIA